MWGQQWGPGPACRPRVGPVHRPGVLASHRWAEQDTGSLLELGAAVCGARGLGCGHQGTCCPGSSRPVPGLQSGVPPGSGVSEGSLDGQGLSSAPTHASSVWFQRAVLQTLLRRRWGPVCREPRPTGGPVRGGSLPLRGRLSLPACFSLPPAFASQLPRVRWRLVTEKPTQWRRGLPPRSGPPTPSLPSVGQDRAWAGPASLMRGARCREGWRRPAVG